MPAASDQASPDAPGDGAPDSPGLDATTPESAIDAKGFERGPDAPRLDAVKPDAAKPDTAKPDLPKPDLAAVPGVWVLVPAGTFNMGSPGGESCHQTNEVLHAVTLTHGFAISARETTQGEFQATMGYNPSAFAACGSGCPVESVSWHEAAAYCNALSAKQGLTACYTCAGSGATVSCEVGSSYAAAGGLYLCKGYRLPTDAEWEYAYRAGTTTALYSGGVSSCTGSDGNAGSIGWYKQNAGNTPHPVGQKAANTWGLHDVAGNVWEWAHDRYLDNLGAGAVTDPTGPATGPDRLCRGGSWLNEPQHMRAAWRGKCGGAPNVRAHWLGFRCAMTK